MNVAIPDGSITVVVGPNACGKSTLLRALARLLKPKSGEIVLDGGDIHALPAKEVARRLGLLPQGSTAPDGIRVADLVARGRYPHQSFLGHWSRHDEEVCHQAMVATGVLDLSGRVVDTLSGGQRQRVWIAMVLAQETPLLLLDEPTTYLDLGHQIELLDLVVSLNRDHGRTVVAVLHDLNQAARYGTHTIAMHKGRIVATGAPEEVLSTELVSNIFGVRCEVIPDPFSGRPLVIPLAKA
ncbi:MAG: ABC transporter ATP-binding protein [Caldilineaceae bacterium]|nr:ABC transporter ATP-binding protein [Caldilineaceae bacterium]